MDIIKHAKDVFRIELDSLKVTMDSIDQTFIELVNIIQKSKGRVIITGIGKAGHVGRKVAATMSSLGTVTYFLHPAEGLHGDLGGIIEGDIAIAFSKSGETEEVLNLIPSIQKIGAKLISVTCNEKSTLSQNSDLHIYLKIQDEASNNKLAPTTSSTAMMVFGDALAAVLEKINNFKVEDFAIFHPSGTLGKRLLIKVNSLIDNNKDYLHVFENTTIKDIILAITSNGLGGVNVIDMNHYLIGLITDGDLRRFIEKIDQINFIKTTAKDLMSRNPVTTNIDMLVVTPYLLCKIERNPLVSFRY